MQKIKYIAFELVCLLHELRLDSNPEERIDILEWSAPKISPLIDGYRFTTRIGTKQKIDISFMGIVEYYHQVGIVQASIVVIVLYDVRTVGKTLIEHDMLIVSYSWIENI